MSKSLVPSASSSLESTVPPRAEPEVGSDKKTEEQPGPASVQEAPQVLRRAPGKIPKWLKLPGIVKSEESSSHSKLPRKAGSSVPNVFDVDSILEDVSIRLAGHLDLVQCLSITSRFNPQPSLEKYLNAGSGQCGAWCLIHTLAGLLAMFWA